MIITERDSKILTFINEFSFSKSNHIHKTFFPQKNIEAARKRLRTLEKEEYLTSVRDCLDFEKIYYLTQKGIGLLRRRQLNVYDPDPRLGGEINWTTFKHDELVIDTYQAFRSCGLCSGLAERTVRSKKVLEDHAPDLLIYKNNGNMICVEVELTQKSQERIYEKINGLTSRADISSILYLYEKESVFNALKKAIEKIPSKKRSIVHLVEIKSFLESPKGIVEAL